MAVPEQRHLFEQRRRPSHHALEPPVAKIENLLAFHHSNSAHLLLEIAALLTCRFYLHARGADVPRMRPRWRRNICRLGVKSDEFPDCCVTSFLSMRSDFPRGSAESGEIQKMPGRLLVPLLC